MIRRSLQIVWGAFGVVAVVTGTLSLVLGSWVQPEAGTVSPSMESELRYYAAWYVVAGVFALRSVRRIESESATVRIIAAGLFAGGLGRWIGWAVTGRPPGILVFLMVVELVLPTLVVPLQAFVARLDRATPAAGSR